MNELLLNDGDIARLLAEAKPLPLDYRKQLEWKGQKGGQGHRERDLAFNGLAGSAFRVILRQSTRNPLDFSAILGWFPPRSNTLFRLCRYNGRSHEHTNKLEAQTFYAFHIHRATARYQQSGLREDSFAEPTDRFADFSGAVDCLLSDCAFVFPPDAQPSLFTPQDGP